MQDVPPAHEMRSGPVLQYTMDYLLSNIADTGTEGQWAEWYEFMWSRTRAIRKVHTRSYCKRRNFYIRRALYENKF